MENKKHLQASKDRLKKIAKKHITTTMIGAIHALEIEFGYLFGRSNGKEVIDDFELSDDELEIKELFEKVRTKILDIGNSQINLLLEDIDQHDIDFKGYKYRFEAGNQDYLKKEKDNEKK